jgi:hypothetical protein
MEILRAGCKSPPAVILDVKVARGRFRYSLYLKDKQIWCDSKADS